MLELRNLSKNYRLGDTNTVALNGISLKLSRGETVALVGPSGSGKSTVLNIAGLIDIPTEGEVLFDHENLTSSTEVRRTEVRKNMLGFIFQQFHLVPVLTVIENVSLPGLLQGRGGDEVYQMAARLLKQVGLGQVLENPVTALSGGQRQRVAIARALINRPALILADEPTANLDAKNGQEALELLFGLCRDTSCGLLLVTHDQKLASRTSREVELKDGRIL